MYVEDLKVKNMTASVKGTVENPGKNVKQKSGLNRAILRTGFYSLRQTIEWQLLKVGGVMIPLIREGRASPARTVRAGTNATARRRRFSSASTKVAASKRMPTWWAP